MSKKAVLSNRIYMNFDDELYEKIKKELTYKLPAKMPGDPPITERTYSVVNKNIISLPIGRTDLIPDDYEVIDKRIQIKVDFPPFKFDLREEQQKVYDAFEDNCLVNANTSWGKTFTGIALAHKMGLKTLVICHTKNLRDQWIEEVEKTLGIKAGMIGGNDKNKTVLDYKNKPIVIGNIQTIRNNVNKLKDEFGTVILDEVHHCPAKMFRETLNTLRARYKIGLSATLRRKDYLHILIPDYFGPKIFKPKKENQMVPEIHMVKTGIPFSSNNYIPWANRVNELTRRPEYMNVVTGLAETYANQGHLVLVVSDRTEFLDSCANLQNDRAVMVYSKTDNRDELHQELEVGNKDILYGSISIYKEGISLNYLSCIILAAPINNDPLLEQLIGRVIRKHPGKPQPVIVDLVLKGATANKQSRGRAAYYMSQRYKIKYIELN